MNQFNSFFLASWLMTMTTKQTKNVPGVSDDLKLIKLWQYNLLLFSYFQWYSMVLEWVFFSTAPIYTMYSPTVRQTLCKRFIKRSACARPSAATLFPSSVAHSSRAGLWRNIERKHWDPLSVNVKPKTAFYVAWCTQTMSLLTENACLPKTVVSTFLWFRGLLPSFVV